MKTQHRLEENACKHIPDKRFVPRIYKAFLQLNKTNNSIIIKWVKWFKQTLHQSKHTDS